MRREGGGERGGPCLEMECTIISSDDSLNTKKMRIWWMRGGEDLVLEGITRVVELLSEPTITWTQRRRCEEGV